jgi:hypothetical protein
MNIESHEQDKLCKYLDYQYPKVLYNSDLSGIRLTIGQANKIKKQRKGRAWPDIFICEPRGKYHGLYIEMKAPGVTIVKRNGEIVSNEHIKEQFAMLCQLEQRGYMARFGIGFEGARKIVDEYFNLK